MLILRCHLDHSLRLHYMQLEDPAELCAQLHSRFNHQQTLFLPQARTDWINLRVLDFPILLPLIRNYTKLLPNYDYVAKQLLMLN
jgi:hypothetical protein